MKYNLAWPMSEADGSVTKGDEGKPVTVGAALRRALLSDYNAAGAGQALGPDEKVKRFALFKRLSDAGDGPLECTIEEAATLKAVAAVYGTLGYGQLVEFLDGKSG